MAATLDDMQRRSPYELATWWGDRARWSAGDGTDPGGELAELAVMCALDAWLRRWAPLHVHRALLGGATVDEVCAATGLTRAGVWGQWAQWAAGQRHLSEHTPSGRTPAGIGPAEYARVRAALGADPDG